LEALVAFVALLALLTFEAFEAFEAFVAFVALDVLPESPQEIEMLIPSPSAESSVVLSEVPKLMEIPILSFEVPLEVAFA